MLVRFVDVNLQPEDEFIQFLSMSKGFQGGTFASFPKFYSPKNVIVLDVDFITALRQICPFSFSARVLGEDCEISSIRHGQITRPPSPRHRCSHPLFVSGDFTEIRF